MSGRYRWREALAWLGIALFLGLLPLGLAAWQMPPTRGWLIELGVACGLLGLGLFLVQALSSGRLSWVAPGFGADNLAHFHRHLGLIATVLVLVHPIMLLLVEPAWLRYLDPRDDMARAGTLWALVSALLLIVVSSMWRSRLGLSYEGWRLLHGFLAVAIIALGTGHALMVDHYLTESWQKLILAGLAAAAAGTVVWTRLVRPWQAWRRPWRLVSVEPERGGAWTVKLKPEGTVGLAFRPGQFAWFSFGSSPWTLQQHPFSLVGSAEDGELRFTASEAGDFTASIKHLEPGSQAWVEGPFGAFVPDPDPATALLLVAGGIGVTPFVSMLRTFRDRGEERRVILVYANPAIKDATLVQALERLAHQPGIELIQVLENPPPDWTGETGRVDEALLRRCLARLSEHTGPVQVMTCGPEPVMDQVESVMRLRGVDWRRVYSERFEIV